jgi:hypothetical protein
MKSVSISELKAKLSQCIDSVRRGRRSDARMRELIRTGQIRPPLRRGHLNLERLDLPADPEGRALAALLEERRGDR